MRDFDATAIALMRDPRLRLDGENDFADDATNGVAETCLCTVFSLLIVLHNVFALHC